MDFIEQIFGIAPDGGSGTLEFFLFTIPILALNLLHWKRSQWRENRSSTTANQAEKGVARDHTIQ